MDLRPTICALALSLTGALFPTSLSGCRKDPDVPPPSSEPSPAGTDPLRRKPADDADRSARIAGAGPVQTHALGADRRTSTVDVEVRPAERNDERFFVGTEWSEDEILERLKSAAPARFRPVGHTSTVLKMTFQQGPYHAAFKAATDDKPRGYLSEVAAYRLARSLGLNNVPPAVTRRLSRTAIRERIEEGYAAQWPALEERMIWTGKGYATGAAIFWVDGMQDLGLETRSGMRSITEWLGIDGEIPAGKRTLVAELSAMLSLDYLMANGDRYSGGNLKGDRSGEHLIVRDHDMAFPRRLPDRVHRRLLRHLLRVERFPRGLYERLKRLTPERFGKELARDPAAKGRPLLDPQQMSGLFDRRETLLSHITALIAQYGEERVLVFP